MSRETRSWALFLIDREVLQNGRVLVSELEESQAYSGLEHEAAAVRERTAKKTAANMGSFIVWGKKKKKEAMDNGE